MRVIINADDFGRDVQATDAICRCFEKGWITNTTLMVNMEDADRAVRLAKEGGFEDRVGLHLNLTAGEPLTSDIRTCPVFCGDDGRFNAAFHLSTGSRLFLNKRDRSAVAAEIEAQIKRYLDVGLELRHMDSHHHVHTDASVWLPAQTLLKRYGFLTVRLGRNIFDTPRVGPANRMYKMLLNSSIKRAGLAGSDHFGSFSDFVYSSENGCLDISGDDICEIMVHPEGEPGGGRILDDVTDMEKLYTYVRNTGAVICPY